MTAVDMAHSLTLKDLRISLDGTCLLALDEVVKPGGVLTVMGPSGSGKSTLLSVLSGFREKAFEVSGRIFCGDLDITEWPPQQRRAGLLFQDPLLFPHMSVGQNLVFAIPAEKRGRARRRAMAEAALSDIGLPDMFDRDPATLSGGQAARVALARTLLSSPAFVLLDEPFSKLDTELRQQMRELVFSTARQSEWPMVLVTHDADDARAAGGKTINLSDAAHNG
ncbi:MAG: ATP-binding cassette domain-containing protein [Pseudomonadota bacterium]